MSSGADSPCIDVCKLDASGRVCIGCFRTLEEIGAWSRLTSAQRAQVVRGLPARRERFEAAAGWSRARCANCGAEFSCGAKNGTQPCWCTRYPPVTPSGAGATCLCPACLGAAGMT